MALVLPILRLWLLLLNIYGTFKCMKPPPQSQRSVRNGQGPSSRAMQLRKRELKSCLAVWVVSAMFSTIEGPMDLTVGLVTPFYNELKCIAVLFLLVARSHGAEAIFLHIIHPILRPYVPAVDDILANLHAAFDLLTLLFFLPFEYVSYRWYRWRNPEPSEDPGDAPPDDDIGSGGGETIRMRLRPRYDSQQTRMQDADRQGQVIFQNIDEAQDRVRNRTRSQPLVQINARGARAVERNQNPGTVGLRTRRKILDYPPAPEADARVPGSRTTGVHHIYPAALDGLPPAPSSHPFPALPSAPTTLPVPLPSQPVIKAARPVPPYHEIWYPPESAPDERRRTPSPVYPPLPSAYKFTPRRSDPLPPPPRIITPSSIVIPTPRRVSASSSRDALDPFDRIDPSSGRSNRAGPSRSAEPLISRHKHERAPAEDEDFFGLALEPSIQAVEMDMDTQTLSARDDSSASANGMEVEVEVGGDESGNAASQTGTRGGVRKGPEIASRRGKRRAVGKSTMPLRRSTRTRRDRSPSVETDEFGFTIRPDSSTLESTRAESVSSWSSASSRMVMGSSVAGPSRKKPLARTKPTVKATHGQVRGGNEAASSSDEESVKKRRKLDSGLGTLSEEHEFVLQETVRGESEEDAGGKSSRGASTDATRGRGKRKGGTKRAAQTVARPARASRALATRGTIWTKESQSQGVGVNRRGKDR